MVGPYFFTVQTVVTTLHRLSFHSPGSTETIGTHVINSVTSLTDLWWSVCHGRTHIDWPDLTVYHFHPLCGRPKASDLLFYCPLFFGEVNRTITFGILYCLWQMHHSGFEQSLYDLSSIRHQHFHSVCFQPRRGEVVLVAALVCTVATYHPRAKRINQKWSKSGPIHSYSPGLDLAQLFFAWKPLTWKADTRGEGRASYFEARGHWPICRIWRVAGENVSWIINESLTCPAQDIYNIPEAHSSSFMWQNIKQVAQTW